MAVREVNGKPADTLVTDLSDPRSGETVTLERYMGPRNAGALSEPQVDRGDAQ